MKILLTGSTGFLGKIILENIKSFNVRTLSRTNSNYNIDLSKSTPNFNENFDVVIHAIGKAHTLAFSEYEEKLFYQVNVIGTLNLLNALAKSGTPKKFVFISSVSVYGLKYGENINETTPLLANDPYGNSKIDAENIIIKWCEEQNVICTILRLPLVVGLNPPGNLGALIQAIKKRYYFNILGVNAQKSMVLASDVAKHILIAAEVGGIYNLTDGLHPTFNNLSKKIAIKNGISTVLNLPLFIVKLLALIGDFMGNFFPINSNKLFKITSTLTFDDRKARNNFGWNPNSVLNFFD